MCIEWKNNDVIVILLLKLNCFLKLIYKKVKLLSKNKFISKSTLNKLFFHLKIIAKFAEIKHVCDFSIYCFLIPFCLSAILFNRAGKISTIAVFFCLRRTIFRNGTF